MKKQTKKEKKLVQCSIVTADILTLTREIQSLQHISSKVDTLEAHLACQMTLPDVWYNSASVVVEVENALTKKFPNLQAEQIKWHFSAVTSEKDRYSLDLMIEV